MTPEEKSLLLQDLSARLPYGVIVRHADPLIDNDGNETGEFWYKRGYLCAITTLDDMTTTIIESEGSDAEGYEHICFLERTLPYLRPMSSMTEEEKRHISKMMCLRTYDDGVVHDMTYPVYTPYYVMEDCLSYLRSIHVDYSGLIEKGLALEAKEGMYNIKEK